MSFEPAKFTLRTEKDLLKKFSYVAENNGKRDHTRNKEISAGRTGN